MSSRVMAGLLGAIGPSIPQPPNAHPTGPPPPAARRREADGADRPHPFAADAIGDVTEHDLTRNAGQAHEAEGPGGVARAEADLDEVFRLVNLHRVPRIESDEVAEHDPPEARRTHRAAERPLDRDPGRVHHVPPMRGGGALRS